WLPHAAWTLRKPISIDPTVADSDELHFPVLVELVDADRQAGARADGADVVFTATDGVTRLDHTIESYDGATGALSSWVRVPTLSASTTTEIFLYFANPTATDQQDPVGVFGSANDLTVTGAS
ncbi:MAG: DUF2341 domain-containing protein, partial [Actinomycetia bacterium]|nr:DUF2341 domain-containing protein [Actinomycetes bacterium]